MSAHAIGIVKSGPYDGKWLRTERGYAYAIYGSDIDDITIRVSPFRLDPDHSEATSEYVEEITNDVSFAAVAMVKKTSSDTGWEFLDEPWQSIKFTIAGTSAGKLTLVQYNED